MRKNFFTICIILATAAYSVQSSHAQVILPPMAGNQLTVTVAASVAQDPATKLYTYSYTVTNATTSAQKLWFLAVELSGDAENGIVNPTSPHGWQFDKRINSTVGWAATLVDNIPADFVDDGRTPPSPYQLKPGQSLSGFSFQSPKQPTNVKVYAQGFAQPPQAVDAGDLDDAGYVVKGYTDDSAIGVTQAPMASDMSSQPSMRGLFSFEQLINDAVRTSPVTVGIHFSDVSVTNSGKLSVTLNLMPVTKLFKPTGVGSDLIATFDLSSSPLINGVNSLRASISGDFNDIKFYVNTPRSLDLNGDGQINCLDLAIVKASMGKEINQSGFDPRADVNGDGGVNVKDLALVAQQLPAGTKCQ